ncbi:MAG: hypothetical protein RL329_2897 [Bacteroidota bacterium]|jgi:hypothetical protein
MNVYFLVEGKRTEKKVYPKWLAELVPLLMEVDDPHKAVSNNYYMFSGNGFPSLLHNHLTNAICDVNEMGNFDYFVICLDSDEASVEERKQEVMDFMTSQRVVLMEKTQFILIIQNKCIETWLLGNTKVFKRNPHSPDLRTYINFYDVSKQDPERMPNFDEFETTAQFHECYLKELLSERNIQYTKKNPRSVTEKAYLHQLIQRTVKTNDIPSFAYFLAFCAELNKNIKNKSI